jgi:hypothetical protein
VSAPGRSGSAASLLKVAVYYAALIGAGWLLVRASPTVAQLFSAQQVQDVGLAGLSDLGRAGAASVEFQPVVATLSLLGALLLVLPVAWIYMITKRGAWYDPSIVQTVILLPIAVAGIAMIVRYSIALAFSLAGIAAAVRFRNTLKDTKDAVYIFLAIGVGLAAGMQALGVALVMSLVFNTVVVLLWKINVAEIYETAPAGAVKTDPGEKPFHGMLRIQAEDPAGARRAVEPLLNEFTKRWRAGDAAGGAGLAYLVRLKKSITAAALIQRINSHAGGRSVTAAFEPFDVSG